MKKNLFILSVMIITLFICTSLIDLEPFNNPSIQMQENPRSASSYNPIIINGSIGYNWSDYTNITGSGSVELPFIIEDFEIDSLGSGSGIFIKDSEFHVIVRNCTINNSGYLDYYDAGIRIENCSNVQIERCNILNNHLGIQLEKSNNCTVFGNTISDNILCGIYTNNSFDMSISNNEINDAGKGIYLDNSENNSISENLVVRNHEGGVFLDGSNNNDFSFNIINNNYGEGFLLNNAHNNSLTNNDIYNNGKGVYLLNSENSTISYNEIDKNHECGVYSDNSDMNLLSNNKIFDNYQQGIYLDYSDQNIISKNYIKKNSKDGIFSINSLSSSISGNIIMENKGFGIFLDISTNDTTIWENNLLNNYLDQAFTASSLNNWDNGTYGNYWGDYTSKYPDASIETVFWNTSYGIEEVGSLDHFPLANPILPEAPTFITVDQTLTFSEITIMWNQLGCAESYELYLDGENIANTTENSHNIVLDLNGIYELDVTAFNLFGESLPSIPLTLIIELIPEIPVLITTNQTSKNKNITIMWESVENVESYNIYVNGTLNTTLTQNSTNIIFNLNAVYNITLTAVNEFGESQPSDPIIITIDITPVYGFILSAIGGLALLGGIAVMILMKKK